MFTVTKLTMELGTSRANVQHYQAPAELSYHIQNSLHF